MSARHTRSGALANDLHNGTCLVPSTGWFSSVMPGGRHLALQDWGSSAVMRG